MIFRRFNAEGHAPPGTWFVFKRSKLHEHMHIKHGHVALVCPDCRGALTISSKVHAIAEDGIVSPSFVCTRPGCSFHTFIRLADW